MNSQGYAIIDAIMHPQDITELKATIKVRRQELVSDGSLTSDFDDRFDIPFMASATPIMTKVACHPVSNWIMRRYMNVPSLHFSHFPILAVMRPATRAPHRCRNHPQHPAGHGQAASLQKEVAGVMCSAVGQT